MTESLNASLRDKGGPIGAGVSVPATKQKPAIVEMRTSSSYRVRLQRNPRLAKMDIQSTLNCSGSASRRSAFMLPSAKAMLDLNQEDPEIPSVTTPPAAPSPMPQFATAEYAHIPSSERCAACGNFIGGEYYRLQNRMVCSACAARVQSGLPAQSHAAFMRALLFGIGAAIAGLAGYAAFTIATHFYLGYLGLGVGWLIAKAILKGSNGIGGRLYQILAVALTYAAISLAEVPILLQRILQNPKIQISLAVLIERIWPRLLWIGIASPFLNLRSGFSGLIGLFILFIGLRIAWTMTQARILPLDGPYPST